MAWALRAFFCCVQDQCASLTFLFSISKHRPPSFTSQTIACVCIHATIRCISLQSRAKQRPLQLLLRPCRFCFYRMTPMQLLSVKFNIHCTFETTRGSGLIPNQVRGRRCNQQLNFASVHVTLLVKGPLHVHVVSHRKRITKPLLIRSSWDTSIKTLYYYCQCYYQCCQCRRFLSSFVLASDRGRLNSIFAALYLWIHWRQRGKNWTV